MRENTSPGRRPPRARHRTWSNCQPDSCTLRASFSMLRWYWSQVTHRSLSSDIFIFLVLVLQMAELLEWVTQHDGFFAVRTGRNHVDRHADQFLNAVDIGARVWWQTVKRLHTNGRLCPTWHFFIDRLASSRFFSADREDIHSLAVQGVASAQLQRFQTIKHIKLGQTHARHTIDLH